MTPAVLCLGKSGEETAGRIAARIGGEVIRCGADEADPKQLLPRLFAEGRTIVGVCAAGILIRLLAPVLENKTAEPPVLAVSQDGQSVVPLLGGHHGANALARRIAEALGGVAAVTTASDSRFTRGLDEPPDGWVLADAEAAKPAMRAVLDGAAIALEGYAPWLAEAGYPLSSDGAVKVRVTEAVDAGDGLIYRPRTLLAGVGCERGAVADEVIALITAALGGGGLSPQSLGAIGTIELKGDEPALHAAARHFGVPLRLFTADELDRERHRLPNPSAVVEAEVGVPGVAEAVALKAGPMVVEKIKSKRATCAIGRAPEPIDVAALGRVPGQLHLVGIGPGEAQSRTAAAVAALAAATDWVGYGLYLDLIADLNTGQAEHRFPLGDEEVRVRHALELAATGKTVAVVSSGDVQIYAMAALAYELLEADGERALSPAARRVAVACHPGISAFQAASAAAGALIGHDFCCISLSDLLTDRDAILRRLRAAAEGDFVTALYNPRSGRRTELIVAAKDMFAAHRQPETPVVVGVSLGRPEQRLKVIRLDELDPKAIDMLSIVLIGASTSRAFRRGDGRTVAYTPRGYAKKAARAGAAG